MGLIKNIKPGRIIVLGFLIVILLGTALLMLPISINDGASVSFVDALFTSTSAVCVTGLIAVDTADTFTIFGRTVVATLIQIGGLGVTSVGVGFILLMGKKVGIKERTLVKESMNLDSLNGIVKLVKSILLLTLIFEGIGVILSYIVFSKDYSPLDALGISMFHSIAAFNNSGFDILGNLQNLIPYQSNILLNLTTCGLIIFGGLGFLVIKEIIEKRSFKKFSLHTKVVLITTGILLVVGTILLKLTEDITWLGAFFFSTSARTAGFSTYSLSNFTNAGLFVLAILMFIGASPGSTGGGIKTTTIFTLYKSIYSTSTNKHCVAFKRRIPSNVILKAFNITLLALFVVCMGTFTLSILEPTYTFMQLLFEVTSAFGTVGLSTGITPDLSDLSKVIVSLIMFIGRLGPMTIATIWYFKEPSNAYYSEEAVIIG
ncbi:Ktr system potassium uptake protein B [uncultured Clostridium sp.]|uniref:TrkH family potassium uptake protein n=1 Tax=uncultured Clostridium sp. TaxID=59620 RepID=UPI0008202A52|nr:potassium transporter TrkG [uncultured Clostridium sp.]SCJ40185.1 Ktr system potassium uptake protein B [uncultured Clostridium sp.]